MGQHSLNQAKTANLSLGDQVLDLLSETRSALLVVDMQEDFCAADGYVSELGLDTTPCRKIIPELQELVEVARDGKIPVLWAVANYDEALIPPSMLRRKKQSGVARTCCVPGTKGFEPFGVIPSDDELRFIKHSYSLFTNPDFEKHLRHENIETLVFSGVQTNVCIEATIREAFNHGFHVIVAEDCVASHTLALHEATLTNVRALIGLVASSAELTKAWQAKK
jgi:ureidoacrylate peracid hydrolase